MIPVSSDIYHYSLDVVKNPIRPLLRFYDKDNNILNDLSLNSWTWNQYYEGYWGQLYEDKHYDLVLNIPSNVSKVQLGFVAITEGTEITNIMFSKNSSNYEPYGEKICTNKIDDTNEKLDNLNDTLNDDDVSGAESEASSFFENFTSDTFGLTSVITSPLNLIQSLTTKSCTPLSLPIPFVGGNFTLPCMSEIYSRHFGSFLQIYQIITFGIVSYYVCIRIFNLVKDFKNPEHDEIEVMDL